MKTLDSAFQEPVSPTLSKVQPAASAAAFHNSFPAVWAKTLSASLSVDELTKTRHAEALDAATVPAMPTAIMQSLHLLPQASFQNSVQTNICAVPSPPRRIPASTTWGSTASGNSTSDSFSCDSNSRAVPHSPALSSGAVPNSPILSSRVVPSGPAPLIRAVPRSPAPLTRAVPIRPISRMPGLSSVYQAQSPTALDQALAEHSSLHGPSAPCKSAPKGSNCLAVPVSCSKAQTLGSPAPVLGVVGDWQAASASACFQGGWSVPQAHSSQTPTAEQHLFMLSKLCKPIRSPQELLTRLDNMCSGDSNGPAEDNNLSRSAYSASAEVAIVQC